MKECNWSIEYDGEQWTVDGEPIDDPAYYMKLQFKAVHHHERQAEKLGMTTDVYELLYDLAHLDMDSRQGITFNVKVAGLSERAQRVLHG